MSCLLDNYPRDTQDEYLRRYAGYGYTHLQRSVGHSLGYGHSLDYYIELTKRARGDYGLFADHWLIANEIPGFTNNGDWNYWRPILEPIIDRLLQASVLDLACVGWQLDQVNQHAPGNATISIIAGVADRLPATVPLYTHWVNEACAWWRVIGKNPDGSDRGEVWVDPKHWPNGIEVNNRFAWWRCMAPYLTGAHYQGNTKFARTDPTGYQGRLRDTLNPFNGDMGKGDIGRSRRRGFEENFRLTNFECTAQDQFDGSGHPEDICSEDEGDLVGFILSCTTSDGNHVPIDGYGNGARLPDGGPL